VSANGVSISPTLTVAFSEPVTEDEAQVAKNYHLNPPIEVATAQLSPDGLHATLTLGDSPQSAGDYRLTITGVHDRSAHANAIESTRFPVALAKPVASIASAHCTGNTIERRISDLPIHAGDSWTINVFAKASQKLEDRTVVAGFGSADDSLDVDGTGRYLTKFSSGVHFWSRHRDVDSRAALELNRWVMLTATYDGKTVRLYKNGQPIGDREVTLSNDEPVVRLAPLDPWDHHRQFQGELHDFTIWREVLPASDLQALQARMAVR
jgi:alpha-mannosidase